MDIKSCLRAKKQPYLTLQESHLQRGGTCFSVSLTLCIFLLAITTVDRFAWERDNKENRKKRGRWRSPNYRAGGRYSHASRGMRGHFDWIRKMGRQVVFSLSYKMGFLEFHNDSLLFLQYPFNNYWESSLNKPCKTYKKYSKQAFSQFSARFFIIFPLQTQNSKLPQNFISVVKAKLFL